MKGRLFNEYLARGQQLIHAKRLFQKKCRQAMRFLGELYDFCNFVIKFSLMQFTMICRRATKVIEKLKILRNYYYPILKQIRPAVTLEAVDFGHGPFMARYIFPRQKKSRND